MKKPALPPPAAASIRSNSDTLSGTREIAAYIGKTERQTHWLLEKRRLPAFKLGAAWHMRPSTYDEFIAKLEGAALDKALRSPASRTEHPRVG